MNLHDVNSLAIARGKWTASIAAMAGVKHYEELDAWQLSVALRDKVSRLIAVGRAAKDFEFCGQIRESTRSAPRNIAEGFGRFKPRQFAQFVRVARGSLKETQNHLQDGVASGYFTSDDIRELLSLQRRALGACTALLKYLDSCKGKAPTGWDVDRKPTRRKRPGTVNQNRESEP